MKLFEERKKSKNENNTFEEDVSFKILELQEIYFTNQFVRNVQKFRITCFVGEQQLIHKY